MIFVEEDVEEEIEEEVEEEIAEEEEKVADEEDTMREQEQEEEEVEEEVSARHSEISTESEPVAMESDSEGVMVEQPSTLKKRSKRSKTPTGPAESTEMECEDVGVAFVDMKRILMEEQDLKDEQIEIKDVETESTVIGHMVVTVECAEVLKAVASEMQVEGTF
ncbi:protein fantom [Elysia marginata]|uniref:Protein fantom n=1 Tax=Elysia marginata TaxID=1093978 RepID=A0AAV4I1C4_9GAST|nr:protein fantom [Elysia marginata]